MFSFALVSQIPTEPVDVSSVYVELWFRSSFQTVHFSTTVIFLKLNNQLSYDFTHDWCVLQRLLKIADV